MTACLSGDQSHDDDHVGTSRLSTQTDKASWKGNPNAGTSDYLSYPLSGLVARKRCRRSLTHTWTRYRATVAAVAAARVPWLRPVSVFPDATCCVCDLVSCVSCSPSPWAFPSVPMAYIHNANTNPRPSAPGKIQWCTPVLGLAHNPGWGGAARVVHRQKGPICARNFDEGLTSPCNRLPALRRQSILAPGRLPPSTTTPNPPPLTRPYSAPRSRSAAS